MTPEKQRIAIAEVCGWKACFIDACGIPYGVGPKSPYVRQLPDYLSGLNAMHEAEKEITLRDLWCDYWDDLCNVTGANEVNDWGKNWTNSEKLLHSTAAQRAEAFLRTLGKWEEVT